MMHKGKIRPPRRVTRIADDFDQNWNLIQDALVDIHDQNAGRLSFEQLYRASYNIVLKKRGEDLYLRVKGFEERHFAEKVIPQIWALVTRNLVAVTLHHVPNSTNNQRRALGEIFLRGIKESWERHNMSMNMVADVLMYLDRGYAQEATRPFIYAATIGLFRDHILRAPLPASTWSEDDSRSLELAEAAAGVHGMASSMVGGVGAGAGVGAGDDDNCSVVRHPTIFTILNSVVFDLINMDREGDIIDRNLLRSCVAMLEALYETDDEHEDETLYLTTFEPEFLYAAYLFYHAECERLLRDGDARAWLRQTRRRLREEQERCDHTISQVTRTKIARVVEQELVAAHLEQFLALEGSGIKAMIDNDRVDDLAILYELVSRVETKKNVLKQALQTRIVDLGLEIEKALKETDFSVAQPAPPPPPSEGASAAEPAGAPGPSSAPSTGKVAALSAAAQQTAAAIKWVNDILELKEKFDRLWVECFNKDIVIQSAMTSSFTELFRLCSRSAEYVSLFVDDCFKRGLRGKSDAEVDAALDKATVMIQHVTEKDMLERYYQKHLARRLLHNKSENPEAEKMMISRMQAELGKTFTSKFEGMFKDMGTSEELTRDYGNYAKENLDDDDDGNGSGSGSGSGSGTRIDLAVSVLTSNNWPPEVMGRSSQLEESMGGSGGHGSGAGGCIYPAEVQRLQASFLKFYLRERSGRVLTWVGSAGSADVRCVFPPVAGHDKGLLSRERRYELNVPTFGMVVLLLFNSLPAEERLSFEEIQAKTNIPAADLTRALASLTIPPKCRVLVKEPMSKTIRPGDRFGFNAHFASKTLKIKVPIINALSKVEGEEERKATEEKNNQTRSHTIDAAVVRIMKQRKELTHTALVTEVVTQLASLFRPEVAMVKKRIEDLISREYLERIEELETAAYRYVA